jgi:hypothetical protein
VVGEQQLDHSEIVACCGPVESRAAVLQCASADNAGASEIVPVCGSRQTNMKRRFQ